MSEENSIEAVKEEKSMTLSSVDKFDFLTLQDVYSTFFIPPVYVRNVPMFFKPKRSPTLSVSESAANSVMFAKYLYELLDSMFGIVNAPERFQVDNNYPFQQPEYVMNVLSILQDKDHPEYVNWINALGSTSLVANILREGVMIVDDFTATYLLNGSHFTLLGALNDATAYISLYSMLSVSGVRSYVLSPTIDPNHRMICGMTANSLQIFSQIGSTITGYSKYIYDFFVSLLRSLYEPSPEQENVLTGWLMDYSVSSTRFSRSTAYANTSYDESRKYVDNLIPILAMAKCYSTFRLSPADMTFNFKNPNDCLGVITFMLYAPVPLRSAEFCVIFANYCAYAVIRSNSANVAQVNADIQAGTLPAALALNNYLFLTTLLGDAQMMFGFVPSNDYFSYRQSPMNFPLSRAYTVPSADSTTLIFDVNVCVNNHLNLLALCGIRQFNISNFEIQLTNSSMNTDVFNYYNDLLNYFFWLPLNHNRYKFFNLTLDLYYFLAFSFTAPKISDIRYMLKLGVNDFLSFTNVLGGLAKTFTHMSQAYSRFAPVPRSLQASLMKKYMATLALDALKPFSSKYNAFDSEVIALLLLVAANEFEYCTTNPDVAIGHADLGKYVYSVADRVQGFGNSNDAGVINAALQETRATLYDKMNAAQLIPDGAILPWANNEWSVVRDYNYTDTPLTTSESGLSVNHVQIRCLDTTPSRMLPYDGFNNWAITTTFNYIYSADELLASAARYVFANKISLMLDIVSINS